MAKKKKQAKAEPEVMAKVLLDQDMRTAINKYYAARLGEDILGRECFSDPKMESHVCSVYARVNGQKKCSRCGNVVGRPCDITCDVHHFCLAVYGVRLGIGGKPGSSLQTRIKYNLDMEFSALHKRIMAKHKLRKIDEPLPAPDTEDAETAKKSKKKVAAPPTDDEGSELITIVAAARLCECTHIAMLAAIDAGRLEKVQKGRATYLRKKDVESFKIREETS